MWPSPEVAALELDLVAEFEHAGLGGFDDALACTFGGLGVEAHVAGGVEAGLAWCSDLGFESKGGHG